MNFQPFEVDSGRTGALIAAFLHDILFGKAFNHNHLGKY